MEWVTGLKDLMIDSHWAMIDGLLLDGRWDITLAAVPIMKRLSTSELNSLAYSSMSSEWMDA